MSSVDVAVPHAPHHEGEHAFKIALVEFAEAPRITLRRLDQQPLIRLVQ